MTPPQTPISPASHRLLRLQQLTAALARASTAERVVAAVADHALEPLDACAGFVALLDGDGHLAITRALGAHEAQLPSCRFPLSARLPAADAVRERAPILVESDAARAARYPSWSAGRWSGYGAWAALPLLADAGPLGAMLLCFPEARVFDDDERTFMQTVASLCAHALDRARLYDREQRARAELERAMARVAEADRRKDEFLAILAHELRNPLAPIVTALELARMSGVEPTREQRIVERQVENLVRLVDDLLDVSRITRGAIELEKEPIEIARAVAQALEIVRPLAERKSHRLDVVVSERGLRVVADPFRIAQALANLLTNAVKYTPEGGVIELSARRDGAQVVVSTKDTGIGIATDLLPRVFEPFVQGASSPHRAGLGIGLTLARRLVEMHGGSIEAASEGAGKGSEFVVRLPAFDAADHRRTAPPPPAIDAPRASGLRVLVVDDNVDARELLGEALALAGHDVTSAADAAEALRVLDDLVPDVAVLDIGLPGLDGYALAARIREQARLASVRLVAVTGYGQDDDRERTRSAGFAAHFVKPVRLAELLSAVAPAPPRA